MSSIFQEHSGNTQAYAAEGGAIQLQKHAHFVDRGWVVQHPKLIPETGILQALKIRPVHDWFTNQFGIGMQNGLAVRIHHGCVVNRRPITYDRFELGVQVGVGGKIVGNGAAHRFGIAGVYPRAGQVGGGVVGQVRYLRSQVVGAVTRVLDLLTKNLGDVNIRGK